MSAFLSKRLNLNHPLCILDLETTGVIIDKNRRVIAVANIDPVNQSRDQARISVQKGLAE